MIEIRAVKTYGLPMALRFMRMPYESFDKSDSKVLKDDVLVIGEKDMELAQRLVKGGSEHRKFLRDIHVHMEVRAPKYLWTEFDTYKFAVQCSSSTMHLIAKRPMVLEDLEHDGQSRPEEIVNKAVLDLCNMLIKLYNEQKDPQVKAELLTRIKRHTPDSYYQLRGLDFNYETAIQMYMQRRDHRLQNWRIFTQALVDNLPHFREMCVLPLIAVKD